MIPRPFAAWYVVTNNAFIFYFWRHGLQNMKIIGYSINLPLMDDLATASTWFAFFHSAVLLTSLIFFLDF